MKEFDHVKDEAEEKFDPLERNSLLLDDLGQMVVQAQEIKTEVEAATAFAQQGPHRLEELLVSESNEAFSSYDAFLKFEREEWLEKQFGRAGDGQQYHHIVEEGINAQSIPPIELQSTNNIIRLPTLLHEEISAAYGEAAPEAPGMTVRQWLKGKSYQFQYDYGLKIMRNLEFCGDHHVKRTDTDRQKKLLDDSRTSFFDGTKRRIHMTTRPKTCIENLLRIAKELTQCPRTDAVL